MQYRSTPKDSLLQARMFLTKTNRWERNFYNTMYRWEHLYKQMQNDKKDEFHWGIRRVQSWTIVPLNENRKVNEIEDCIVRVSIQPSV